MVTTRTYVELLHQTTVWTPIPDVGWLESQSNMGSLKSSTVSGRHAAHAEYPFLLILLTTDETMPSTLET